MKQRIDTLFEGASFRLGGDVYTIRRFQGNMALCERADGSAVYLHGWEETESWEPRRTFKDWFSFALP